MRENLGELLTRLAAAGDRGDPGLRVRVQHAAPAPHPAYPVTFMIPTLIAISFSYVLCK